jgi:hypothetical protein
MLKSQVLLLLPTSVLSVAIDPAASKCAAGALPTPSVYGASVLSVDAVDSILGSASIGFCNVTLTYTHPGQHDLIKVWLALPSAWNGRFQGVGGGGWTTGFPSNMIPAISQGYAAVSTDGGHDGVAQTPQRALADSWALNSPGNVDLYALQNFASVALNDMTVLGKQLTEAYYDKPISKSYWVGCSTGGRQGLMMAQRYPDAYDGILAQAPAVNWAGKCLFIALCATTDRSQNSSPPCSGPSGSCSTLGTIHASASWMPSLPLPQVHAMNWMG